VFALQLRIPFEVIGRTGKKTYVLTLFCIIPLVLGSCLLCALLFTGEKPLVESPNLA
jgi:hypothetical protein